MAEEDAAVTAFAIEGENFDNIDGGFEFSQIFIPTKILNEFFINFYHICISKNEFYNLQTIS